MNLASAVDAFGALSQETRLKVFKTLIEYGPSGAAAGVIGERLGVKHNTLSFHLSQLADVGLVTSRKEGRSVIYSPCCDTMDALIQYLQENCCILDTGCCDTEKKEKP